MRIISGSAGGIQLQVPRGEVRPTTDRVREALFSILGDLVENASVLDLFAGSGSLSLESLSRGARSAVLVEGSRTACDVIQKNCTKTRLKGARVVNMDAVSYVARESRAGGKFELIFADPPYCKGPLDRDFLDELLTGDLYKLLKGGGIFVAEAEVGWGIARKDFIFPDGWKLVTRREYGKNALLFFQWEGDLDKSE